MGQEPRKATDILLDLESKIEVLLNTVRSQELNIKIISNKLNEVMKGLEKQNAGPQKIIVEAVQNTPVPNQVAHLFNPIPPTDPERNVVVTAESKLPMEDGPKGFRRNSRPESYSDEKSYRSREVLPPPPVATPSAETSKANKPPPGRSAGEVVTAQLPSQNKVVPAPTATPIPKMATGTDTHGIVPVEQRVVDRNGKSVFLADVEIIDTATSEQVSKSRTNATGKWMAALPLGNYKVVIRKLESLTREKIESVQTISVDGSEVPLRLKPIIIK